MGSNKRIKQDLLENAIDSLEEGLRKYQDGIEGNVKSFKFAILNTSHFLELSFKYFLTKIHPLLIYENPYAEKLNRNRTIRLDEAINFFKHANEEGLLSYPDGKDGSFLKDISCLKEIRNNIEHHEFELDQHHVEAIIGKILSVLDNLHNAHEVNIKSLLQDSLSSLYEKIIDEYKRQLLIAEKDAAKMEKNLDTSKLIIDVTLRTCSDCGNRTSVYDSEKNEYKCTFCGENEEVATCQWCSTIFPINESVFSIEESDIYFCSDSCLESDKNIKGCGRNQ